ncbi:MAG: amidohydrolase [Thermodesulfobacteriota bacterium]
MLKEIEEKVEEIKERLIKFRREIHSNPELSGEEKNTAAFVAGVLEASDVETIRNIGGHGVVGIIRGTAEGGEGKTFAMRADMDALPLQEVGSCPYVSTVAGVMHACGHDVHTAVLMGTAVVLASLKDQIKGNVKLIFQPSEELSIIGAKFMIEDGVLEDPVPDAIVALHCFPEIQAGNIAHRPGIMTACADKMTITIKGKGGHASRPHQTVDAILVASLVINAIHHIVSRRTDPLDHSVISIGTIHGGDAPNIIADRVVMEGTVRAFNEDVRKDLARIMEDTIRGVTAGIGGEYEFEYHYGTPPVINDAALDGFVKNAALDLLGEECVHEMNKPMMGAEDFAYFAQKVPGVLFRLGTCNPEKGITEKLHSSSFDVDEDVLAIGTKLMSWMAVKYLNEE